MASRTNKPVVGTLETRKGADAAGPVNPEETDSPTPACRRTTGPIRGKIYELAALAVVVILLSFLVRTSLRYPYYFIWDMDAVTTMDTVLIDSGFLPDHINHTGFGMYLALSISSRLARAFDVTSIGNLDDIRASLNPLGGMGELTEYFRLHTPYLILAMVLALWISLRLFFSLSPRLSLLALAFLAFQESLFYQAAMIRTELYCLVYFSLAILAAAAAISVARARISASWVFAAGIFLGLAFLTKIQVLLFVVVFPFLMVLGFLLKGFPAADVPASRRLRVWTAGLSLLNVLAFTLLLVLAYRTYIPEGYGTFTKEYRITGLAIASELVLVLLFASQVFALNAKRQQGALVAWSRFFVYLASGFLFAFLLHFPLYSDLHTAGKYMLFDFKVLFLRHNPFSLAFGEMMNNLYCLSKYAPVLIWGHFCILALLVVGRLTGVVTASWRIIAVCVALTGLWLAHLTVGTRFILRDLVWAESLADYLSLAYLAILVRYTVSKRPLMVGAAVACIAVSLGASLNHIRYMGHRIDANYNTYGWSRDKWYTGNWQVNQRKYSEAMDARYTPEMWAVARANADHLGLARRNAEFVFQNQVITQRQLGLVAEGFPVSAKDPSMTITSFSPLLRNAVIIDSAGAPLKSEIRLRPGEVRDTSERLDKFSAPNSGRTVSVLPRVGLKVLLFAQGRDLVKLDRDQIAATDYGIVVQKGSKVIGAKAVEITKYYEIPVELLANGYFFVILVIGT